MKKLSTKFIRALPMITREDGPFCTVPALSWATSLPKGTIEMATNTRYAIPSDAGPNSAIRIHRLSARQLKMHGHEEMVLPFDKTVEWLLTISAGMDRTLAESVVKTACQATSRAGIARLGKRTALASVAHKAYARRWPQKEGALQ